MERSRGTRRVVRRALAATAVVAAMALFSACPAFAELGLGGALSGDQNSTRIAGGVVDTVSAATAPLTDPQQTSESPDLVSSTVESMNETVAPARSAMEPVLARAAPVAQETAAAVQSTAQPVLETAAPLVKTAAPVVATVTHPIVNVTAPVLDAATPALEATEPLLGSTPRLAAATTAVGDPLAPARDASGAVPRVSEIGQQGSAIATPPAPLAVHTSDEPAGRISDGVAGHAVQATLSARPRRGHEFGRLAERSAVLTPVWAPTANARTPTAGSYSGSQQASVTPHPRAPDSPGNPLGLLSSVASGGSSGASLLVFAAFVAALLLVAPGMGRRLRPVLAPWPRPIALPSLERPG